ncbi:hypothetical protein EVAR_49045_1 [Eumeta japonica]|uniref:Uncharacterized protein n=1 Tax=Eumeta variegata TaxID=151549 RepID=A0A4C1ZWQ8_EUMVA|nr:hypothetical protein EVAR_49045_1 [Eumeta japonica]
MSPHNNSATHHSERRERWRPERGDCGGESDTRAEREEPGRRLARAGRRGALLSPHEVHRPVDALRSEDLCTGYGCQKLAKSVLTLNTSAYLLSKSDSTDVLESTSRPSSMKAALETFRNVP